MKESDIFIEVDCFQKNKAGNIVCGDSYMSQKLKEEDRIISVLSDGLGSGIKASVLSAMTGAVSVLRHELHSHERKYSPNRSLDYPYPA